MEQEQSREEGVKVPVVEVTVIPNPSGGAVDDERAQAAATPEGVEFEKDATSGEWSAAPSPSTSAAAAAEGEGEGEGASSPSDSATAAKEQLLQGEEEEEEEEECGFCLFMKGGPCGQRFSLWQDCVEGAEKSDKDIVQECAQLTTLLKVCMEMNPEYYGPVLDAEKAMEAEVSSSMEETFVGGGGGGDKKESESSQEEGGGGEQTSPRDEDVVAVQESVNVVVDDKGEVQGVIKTDEVVTVVKDDKGEVEEVVDAVAVKATPPG